MKRPELIIGGIVLGLGAFLLSKASGGLQNEPNTEGGGIPLPEYPDKANQVLANAPEEPIGAYVEAYQAYFGGRHRFDYIIAFMIDNVFGEQDPAFVKAIMATESGKTSFGGTVQDFNPNALRIETGVRRQNPDGSFYIGSDVSCGLMQLRTDTARWLRNWNSLTDDEIQTRLFDPRICVFTGMLYLRYQASRYKTHDKATLAAAYNAGSAKRKSDGSWINQGYVNKVLGFYSAFKTDFGPKG